MLGGCPAIVTYVWRTPMADPTGHTRTQAANSPTGSLDSRHFFLLSILLVIFPLLSLALSFACSVPCIKLQLAVSFLPALICFFLVSFLHLLSLSLFLVIFSSLLSYCCCCSLHFCSTPNLACILGQNK